MSLHKLIPVLYFSQISMDILLFFSCMIKRLTLWNFFGGGEDAAANKSEIGNNKINHVILFSEVDSVASTL